MNPGRARTLRRVLTLARYLQPLRYAPPLRDLATALGVHPRTIRRDLEALEEVGWPLPAWRHRDQSDTPTPKEFTCPS